MRFEALLSRADDVILQKFLGGPAVRLLMSLDSQLATPTKLRELVVRLKKPEGLLLTPETREELFSLLRPDEALELAGLLGLQRSGDPYKQLELLNLQRGSKRERLLFGFFELEVPTLEEQVILPTVEKCDAGYGLFDYQRHVVRQVAQVLSELPHRALLHMPTGSGKTRTAMNIIADCLRANEPTLVVWLAYSEELCEQAAEEFLRCWKHLGNRTISLYRFWGNHNLDMQDVRDGVVIAGLSKLYSSLKRNSDLIITLGNRSSLIVIDEAHQAIAKTYNLVLNVLFTLGQKTALLGLTATPGRTWADMASDEELANFFGRRKVTLQIPGYRSPIDYLVEEGYIAKTTFTPLTYNGGYRLSTYDLTRIIEALDIPEDILERLGEDEQRNLLIILKTEELARKHKRILVFASSVRNSDLLACVLQARGWHAYSLTSSVSASERARLISDYKDTEDIPKILCNYGILTTGFDAPKTSAAVIARPTKSLVLYSQMVGRAIRGERAGGNANAEIVTIVDQSLPGFGSVAEAFYNWEDVWRNE